MQVRLVLKDDPVIVKESRICVSRREVSASRVNALALVFFFSSLRKYLRVLTRFAFSLTKNNKSFFNS